MFCEKCGTRVDDGQPFCPNCGNRLAEPAAPTAPVNPGFTPAPAAAPVKAAPDLGGLLGKFNSLQGLEKIFYPIVGGLLVVCFILSLLKVFSYYGGGIQMEAGSIFFTRVITVLFTLAIAFFVLDYFDKFTFKWLWFFIAGVAALIFVIFVIMWIDIDTKLTAGGWIFLIFQAGLTALAILLLIEKLKKH